MEPLPLYIIHQMSMANANQLHVGKERVELGKKPRDTATIAVDGSVARSTITQDDSIVGGTDINIKSSLRWRE